MKKYIFKILIAILFFLPFVLMAQSRDYNSPVPAAQPGKISNLFVYTNPATDVTYTTATLHGAGGDALLTPTLPITAYFRYSRLTIPPIFCNDIYGTRMIVTKDIAFGGGIYSKPFSINISGLIPDTIYYYCAIISNKENIAYGGNSVVKTFHTSPLTTTIRTSSATSIKPTSVKLNGTYSSRGTITTYFEYRRYTIDGTSPVWNKVGERVFSIGNLPNVYGNLDFDLSGLSPSTRYQFRAVGKNTSGNESKIFYGSTTIFTTSGTTTANNDPVCIPPRVYNPFTRSCANPTDPTPISCTPPQVYSFWSGSCITPAVCTSPTILNPYTNTCMPPPPPDFCETNPTDPICLPGPGWKWTDDGWTDGDWTRDGWRDSGQVCESGAWVNGVWTGINCEKRLDIGTIATPPADAIVRYQEGIEHVFARQISANLDIARTYGYVDGTDIQTFSWNLADVFARVFGYIREDGREIRVSLPDIAAYQLSFTGNKLTVYEYYDGRIIDIRKTTVTFKNASYYEYYFTKR